MAEPPGAIVVAVYKPDAALLHRQLASIRDQSCTDWTCIVGIDGRDAQAVTLVHGVVGGDERFQVIEFERNVGIYRHFERLLALVPACAAWVALSDQDDYWHPTKLKRMADTLSRTGSSAAMCQAHVTTRDGKILGQTNRRAAPLVAGLLFNQITGCMSMFSTDTLRLALPFPDAGRHSIHDHWLGVCAASLYGVHVMVDVLHDYVQHDANAIGERPLRTVREAMVGIATRRVSLKELSGEPWAWRTTMARALEARAPQSTGAQVGPIAVGTLSRPLWRLMARQVRRGHVPSRVAAALLLAAARGRS